MKERNEARPGLPPDARAEILEALCSNMEISSDEIVAKQKFYIFCYQTDRMREDRPTPDLNYLYRGRTKRRSGKEERE